MDVSRPSEWLWKQRANLEGLKVEDFMIPMILRALPENMGMYVNINKPAEDIVQTLDNLFTMDGKVIEFK